MMAMKNLANCTPIEFLKQTARIKGAVEKWLDATRIFDIRNQPVEFPADATIAERKAIVKKQATKNLGAIIDAIAVDHPEETVELLALCCFIEPENANDYTMSDYLSAINALLCDEGVLSFFTSLITLGNGLGLK